jgi:hypothetical protein
MNNVEWFNDAVREAWGVEPPNPVRFAEDFVQLPGSAIARHFYVSATPWLAEPLYRAAQGIWTPPADFHLDMSTEARTVTLMKPVQTGGSTFGEVMMLYWIIYARGIIQYNWTDDDKAKERWAKRLDSILDACAPVKEMRRRLQRDNDNICAIDFGPCFLQVQGAFNPNNLDSDTVPNQINEEVHNWKPGHLAKARNRSSAVWNFKSLDVSNAGDVGSQMDKAFKDGTAQHWEVKCPGCGQYHRMRTRWNPRHPELGGLRYDSAKRKDGSRDYNEIERTARFQMPCGAVVRNNPAERKALSVSGRYSEPTNKEANLKNRSYTYQAVSVDFIDWVGLIKKKYEALLARDYGDPKPWEIYMKEQECVSFDPDDVPLQNETIVVNSGKKNRDGLPGEKIRLGQLDRQQGNKQKGELPHWWGTIRDFAIVDGKIKSLLVFEGKLETDELAARCILADHGCRPWNVCVDSGNDTTHVYLFCMQHGFNAIKGGSSKESLYPHPDGSRRIFSPERPLHSMIGAPPKYQYLPSGGKMIPDPREPMFWLYSKGGIRERFHWLRSNTDFGTPEDVSDDYRAHMESEVREESRHPSTGEPVFYWYQRTSRNDLFVCECYCAMQLDMAGWVGSEVAAASTSGAQNQKNKP